MYYIRLYATKQLENYQRSLQKRLQAKQQNWKSNFKNFITVLLN